VFRLVASRTWARRLTQSPELGLGFCLFSSGNDFDLVLPFCFTQWSPLSLECCCATVRTLLRSPTGDAATPPAFLPWPRSPASFRFFHHAPPVSGPSASNHSRYRTVPGYAALPAPAGFADTDRLPCHFGACGPRNLMKIIPGNIATAWRGEVESAMDKSRPFLCLTRSVRD